MTKYSDPVDLIFFSLGHPIRREILKLIRSKDHLVTELASHFETSLNAISKHIKVLEKAKLIHRTKDGRLHRISLNQDALLTAEEWLKQYRAFWAGRFDELDNYLEKTLKPHNNKK